MAPTLSTTATLTDQVAQEEQLPVLGVSNTAAGITEIGDYIHRDSLTEDQVIPQTIAAAKESLGLSNVVVMYSNDDAFTEYGYEAFQAALDDEGIATASTRSEEHTSELQSLMRNSYAVFCLKKTNKMPKNLLHLTNIRTSVHRRHNPYNY